VIEWANRFPELIPARLLWNQFRESIGEQARWVSFEVKSERQRIITLFHHGHENSRA